MILRVGYIKEDVTFVRIDAQNLPWTGGPTTRSDAPTPHPAWLLTLNVSKDGTSTTSLGSMFQCLTTLNVKNFFLITNLNFPLSIWNHFPLFYGTVIGSEFSLEWKIDHYSLVLPLWLHSPAPYQHLSHHNDFWSSQWSTWYNPSSFTQHQWGRVRTPWRPGYWAPTHVGATQSCCCFLSQF